MNAKPWQLALIIIGLLGGSALVVYNLFFANAGPSLADTMKVIDVNTGELFEVDLAGKGYVMPGKNPNSKKRTLLAIVKDEQDGTWFIPGRYLPSLDQVDGEVTAVDPQTGEVKAPVGEFKRIAHPTQWDETLKR
jgi:hypothetical protein